MPGLYSWASGAWGRAVGYLPPRDRVVDIVTVAGPAVTTIATTWVALSLVSGWGHQDGRKEMQVEAVKAGHADWVPDADGNVTFRWR